MLAILVTKDALPILALRASRGAIAIHQIPNLAQFSKNRRYINTQRFPLSRIHPHHSITHSIQLHTTSNTSTAFQSHEEPQQTSKMVAIQSILSILAMTAIANALQSELVARGEVVSNYRFFNGKGCNFAESPSRRLSLFSVPRPATLRSHKTRDRSASATPRRTLVLSRS